MRRFVPDNVSLIPDQAELKFAGEIFDVYQWPQEMFDGSMATFEMLRRADTVVIIAIKDDKVVITRQKQPRKDWYYGFPGGRVDETDTDELAAAKRELREETGMTFRNWKLINVAQPFMKVDWLVYTFLATDFIRQESQSLDAGELIEVQEISFEELLEYCKRPDAKYLKVDLVNLGEIQNLQQLIGLPAVYNY